MCVCTHGGFPSDFEIYVTCLECYYEPVNSTNKIHIPLILLGCFWDFPFGNGHRLYFEDLCQSINPESQWLLIVILPGEVKDAVVLGLMLEVLEK